MSKTFPCKKHFPGSAPGGYLWGTTDDVVHVREEDLATLIAASHGDIYEVPADEAEAEGAGIEGGLVSLYAQWAAAPCSAAACIAPVRSWTSMGAPASRLLFLREEEEEEEEVSEFDAAEDDDDGELTVLLFAPPPPPQTAVCSER